MDHRTLIHRLRYKIEILSQSIQINSIHTGPLANGATTLMFESTPLYPDAGRYWDMVQRHRFELSSMLFL